LFGLSYTADGRKLRYLPTPTTFSRELGDDVIFGDIPMKNLSIF